MSHRKAHKVLLGVFMVFFVLVISILFVLFFNKNDNNTQNAEFVDCTTEDQLDTIDWGDCPIEIQAGTFDLDSYKTNVHRFRVDYSIDAIDSAQAAAESAIRVWEKEYGYIAKNYPQPRVYYDSNAECWLIIGSPPNIVREEGVAYVYSIPIVLIQADGTVLATWLT